MKTSTIKQGAMMPGTPHEVFELWMDEKKHAGFTKGEAKISRQVGGSFVTFDGWASGKNVEIVKDQKVVQTWRGEDWPAGHYSTLTLALQPTHGGTKLMFTQVDVPTAVAKDVAEGWRQYYWGPMKRALAKKQ